MSYYEKKASLPLYTLLKCEFKKIFFVVKQFYENNFSYRYKICILFRNSKIFKCKMISVIDKSIINVKYLLNYCSIVRFQSDPLYD